MLAFSLRPSLRPAVAALLGLLLLLNSEGRAAPLPNTSLTNASLTNASPTHDPSTPILCGNKYWVFMTGPRCPSRYSTDLTHWTNGPAALTALPAWVKTAVPKKADDVVWAPEVVRRDGQYCLYYALSTWGSNTSAIGLLTTPTLEPTDPRFHWTDQGIVVQTHTGDIYNAIDPALIAKNGAQWLSYGSFFGGIALLPLDPRTGKSPPGASPRPLANQGEASYVYARGGWYYLFTNWGFCCRGKDSTYNIRVGRARTILGPYRDKAGVDMQRGGGTLFLDTADGQIGPGQIGIFTAGGREQFSCHYEWDSNFGGGAGRGNVFDIRPLTWDKDGWPVAGRREKSPPPPNSGKT